MATGTITKYMDGTDSGWLEITGTAQNSYPFTGTVYYRKVGNVVEVESGWLLLKNSVTAKNTVDLFTLDIGYRPYAGVVCNAYINNTNDINVRIVPALLNGAGTLVLYANNNEGIPAAYMRLTACFIAA